MPLPPIEVTEKTGQEPFAFDGSAGEFRLIDFWRWCMSDLVNNATRGVLAEFLVARAIGADKSPRSSWDAYDLVTSDGVRIEVKSAAYIQSWFQKDYSQINFDVAETRAWQAETNQLEVNSCRQADVYVFALLDHKDQQTINPLELSQWVFYVLPTTVLNARVAGRKSLSLAVLQSMQPIECRFDELKDAVAHSASSAG